MNGFCPTVPVSKAGDVFCLDVMRKFDEILHDPDVDWDTTARRLVCLAADSMPQFDIGMALDQIQPGTVAIYTPDPGTNPNDLNARFLRSTCNRTDCDHDQCNYFKKLTSRMGFGDVEIFVLRSAGQCMGALLCRGSDAEQLKFARPFLSFLADHISGSWGLVHRVRDLMHNTENQWAEAAADREKSNRTSEWFKLKLQDLRQSQTKLLERLSYEQALTDCSRTLLAGHNEDDALVQAMESLLKATRARRIILCLNDNTGFSTTMTHAVTANDWQTNRHSGREKSIAFDQGFFAVAGGLGRGEIIQGSVTEMDEGRTTAFRKMGLHSFALIPFFVLDEWVGFLGFGSDTDAPPWENEDIDILRSASEMVGIYFERERMGRQVRRSEETTRALLNAPTFAAVLMDKHGVIMECNEYAATAFDVVEEEAVGTYLTKSMKPEMAEVFDDAHARVVNTSQAVTRTFSLHRRHYEIMLFPILGPDHVSVTRLAFYLRDNTDEKEQEQQNSQDQRLASIGQLAAGIAHEINSPLQYITNYTQFLNEAFTDLKGLLEGYAGLMEKASACEGAAELIAEAHRMVKDADLDFMLEEIPNALKHTTDGIAWVTKIVRSMKELSHPGQVDMSPVDLNKAVEASITVSRNEWKYAAELESEFDEDLPLVTCMGGEINQAVLNLIVNAAHAVADTGAGQDGAPKGIVGVRTRRDGDMAEITITDTGTGIPEDIQARIFDPFFTTKDVGKGTGQGLAIAYSVIVKKHKGSLTFQTEQGRGTSFVISIPIAGNGSEPETCQSEPVSLEV